MYIIKYLNKRFNNKQFNSYEDARKYARRSITRRFGAYSDSIGDFGFRVVKQ